MEESVIERIKCIIENERCSTLSFSNVINVPRSTISNMFLKRTNPGYDLIRSVIDAFPAYSVDWLITGNGEMLKSEKTLVIPNTDGIPLYRIEAAAGFGNSNFSIDDNDIEARYKIKELETASFMLHVRGDSMNPTYCNGDVIAVQVVTDKRKIQWGKPHLISSSSDGLLVKRIYDDEEDVIAVSDNPTYKPIRIDKDEINGVAIVKGCVKFEN